MTLEGFLNLPGMIKSRAGTFLHSVPWIFELNVNDPPLKIIRFQAPWGTSLPSPAGFHAVVSSDVKPEAAGQNLQDKQLRVWSVELGGSSGLSATSS